MTTKLPNNFARFRVDLNDRCAALAGQNITIFQSINIVNPPPGHFPTNRTVSIHNRQTRRTLQHHLLVRIGRYGHQTNVKPNTGKPPQVAGNKQLHNTSWRGEGQDQRTSSANLSHMRLKSLGHSPSDNNPLRAKMLFTGRLVTVKPIEVEENGTPAEQKRTRLRSALDCIPDSC